MDGIALIKALLERPLATTAEVEAALAKKDGVGRAVKTQSPREVKSVGTNRVTNPPRNPRDHPGL